MSGHIFTKKKKKIEKKCVVCSSKILNAQYNSKYCFDHKKNYGAYSYATHYSLLKNIF